MTDMAATQTTGLERPRDGFWTLMRSGMSAQAMFFVLAVAYAIAFEIFAAATPNARPTNFGIAAFGILTASVPLMMFCLALTRMWAIAFVQRSKSPLSALAADLKAYLGDRRRLANGLPMLLAFIPYIYAYTAFKNNIPVVMGFDWDQAFSALDRALHFGADPWVLLHPVFGNAPMTFLLNINYNLWFIVMWGVWVFFAFSEKSSETRTRFFLCFMLTWLAGGTVMAFYYSSAGPCFFERMGFAPDPYAPLMAHLNAVNATLPIWALDVQNALWDGYLGKGELEGISAMPSMHCSSALLFAMAGFRASRLAGWLLSIHAGLILLGSVYLGWHYAVDGYAAFAFTWICWKLCGPIARWHHATPAVVDFEARLAQRS